MRYIVVILTFLVCGCSFGPPAVDVQTLTSRSASGDLQAQYQLAYSYETGNGVPADFGKALELYSSAAEQGYAAAQMTMGYFYQYGQGVPKDPKKALYWSGKAAEQGNPTAAHNIGVMYDEGVDIPEDNTQAIKWYTKAVSGGSCHSMINLGLMYRTGEGTPKDNERAWNLFNDARFRCNSKYIHSKAVEQLDGIKHELGVDHFGGIGRFSYPDWEEVMQAAQK